MDINRGIGIVTTRRHTMDEVDLPLMFPLIHITIAVLGIVRKMKDRSAEKTKHRDERKRRRRSKSHRASMVQISDIKEKKSRRDDRENGNATLCAVSRLKWKNKGESHSRKHTAKATKDRRVSAHTKISSFMELMSAKPSPQAGQGLFRFFGSCFRGISGMELASTTEVPKSSHKVDVRNKRRSSIPEECDGMYTLTKEEMVRCMVGLTEDELVEFLANVEEQLTVMRANTGTIMDHGQLEDGDLDTISIVEII